MAHTQRKAETKTTAPTTPATTAGELTCPECGKTFGRAAALGAHRRRAHGVAGPSGRTRSRRPSARATGRSRSATAASNGRRSSNEAGRGVDRDALLAALFPNGLPAREALIRAANQWLDEAEQLARMK